MCRNCCIHKPPNFDHDFEKIQIFIKLPCIFEIGSKKLKTIYFSNNPTQLVNTLQEWFLPSIEEKNINILVLVVKSTVKYNFLWENTLYEFRETKYGRSIIFHGRKADKKNTRDWLFVFENEAEQKFWIKFASCEIKAESERRRSTIEQIRKRTNKIANNFGFGNKTKNVSKTIDIGKDSFFMPQFFCFILSIILITHNFARGGRDFSIKSFCGLSLKIFGKMSKFSSNDWELLEFVRSATDIHFKNHCPQKTTLNTFTPPPKKKMGGGG